MAAPAQFAEKLNEISQKFKEGRRLLFGLIENKKYAYTEFRRYKTTTSEPVRYLEQMEAIINNQIVILNYYENEALPQLVQAVDSIITSLHLDMLPDVSKLLRDLQKAFAYAQEKMRDDLKILKIQKPVVNSLLRYIRII